MDSHTHVQRMVHKYTHNRKNDTGVVVTGELKRIHPCDLGEDNYESMDDDTWKERLSKVYVVNQAAVAEAERMRSKCRIYHLCMNATMAELNEMLHVAFAALHTDKRLPQYDSKMHASDVLCVERAQKFLLETDRVYLKIAYMWSMLLLSETFVQHFAPATATGTFGTDPKKLLDFIRAPKGAFRIAYTKFVSGFLTHEEFAVQCCARWIELEPWERMDKYAALDPMTLSAGVQKLIDAQSVPKQLTDASAPKRLKGPE